MPMGYVRDVAQSALPAGLQFLARPWDEGRLLGIAYAWEQATQYRMCAPVAAPASSLLEQTISHAPLVERCMRGAAIRC